MSSVYLAKVVRLLGQRFRPFCGIQPTASVSFARKTFTVFHLQSQRTVAAYFLIKQLLPFGLYGEPLTYSETDRSQRLMSDRPALLLVFC